VDYYEELLSRLKRLNPGTRYFVNRIFNPGRFSFMERSVDQLRQINEAEAKVSVLSREEMRSRTAALRERARAGEPLDSLLVEGFALVREASRRTTGLRHFDVQMLGGMVLHAGQVAEMVTGEGKTLVATLPLYLNALLGRGVHLVTVNDYLAKRDTQWMGHIYHYLGLSVGCIISYRESRDSAASAFLFDPAHLPADSRFLNLRPVTRREAYLADITYGVGSEFGFDYLRDNMAVRREDQVQRPLYYAIIDEVDSILIDEARTPLIISGAAEESTRFYYDADRLVRKLNKDTDYIVDEEAQTVTLTEDGIRKCERLLGIANLYDGAHTEHVHHIHQALRAHTFFHRDKEYVVKDGEVVIVDEFTGRLMPGRRWSDGLHQAVEAKEGLRIESENQTLATVSFQNYFRLYEKIAGMTGTAMTEAAEFLEIYKLPVTAIPTNKPLRRTEFDDEIYRNEKEKFAAVVAEIEKTHAEGRPVLVGTISIEKAEKLSRMLKHRGIPHQVLHGKNHEAEAAIIAQAGRPGAVTIATQMAGRGVDIILGGNPEILAREETIRIIWSRKRQPSRDRQQPRLLADAINEIEEAYKRAVEQIEKTVRPEVDRLREALNEKEKAFTSEDQRVREAYDHAVFLARGGAEFERLQPRLVKLRERHKEASLAYLQAQRELRNKPELLREPNEAAGRAYRELEAFRAQLKQRFGVVEPRDIEDCRSRFLEGFHRLSPATRRQTLAAAHQFSELLEAYRALIAEVMGEPVTADRAWKAFERAVVGYRKLLGEISSLIDAAVSADALAAAADRVSAELKQAEDAAYHDYLDAVTDLEGAVFAVLGGAEYTRAVREERRAREEYEREQSRLDELLSQARADYEKARSAHEEEWKKAREELEKSPEEFAQVYEEVLKRYREPWEQDHARVVAAGGLHIVGTERYEARRIDNQLRGRAGRQGDPGSARFYLSLEDDLLRIFGSERLAGIMSGLPEGENIRHPFITKMINNAQKKVEARNFEIRKQLLEFDNVLNEQRKIIYAFRQDLLTGADISDRIDGFIAETVEEMCDEFLNLSVDPEEWNLDGFARKIQSTFGIEMEKAPPPLRRDAAAWRENAAGELLRRLRARYAEKRAEIAAVFPEFEKLILLQVIDSRWRAHLKAIDDLREGIGLRAYAQKDPLVAYKHEAYQMFQEMLAAIRAEALGYLWKVQVSAEAPPTRPMPARPAEKRQEPVAVAAGRQHPAPAQPRPESPAPATRKVGRNDPCPCGSGKKYKKCCGRT